ncbi:protein kinase family protein [Spongiimicrobium salis]|uniref:hypothetical protein n=1 Tax=Spongiimicrobium salis TaxID=1667022 RepID=UPI00374D129B
MKTTKKNLLVVLVTLLSLSWAQAQYGNGYGRQRQRSRIPQAQTPQKEQEPLTPEQMVDNEMPKIIKQIALNEFETAIMRATLLKFLKSRNEVILSNLPQRETQEAISKLFEKQDAELKAGLPQDKYEAFIELRNNGFKKKKKKKRKKKKNKD